MYLWYSFNILLHNFCLFDLLIAVFTVFCQVSLNILKGARKKIPLLLLLLRYFLTVFYTDEKHQFRAQNQLNGDLSVNINSRVRMQSCFFYSQDARNSRSCVSLSHHQQKLHHRNNQRQQPVLPHRPKVSLLTTEVIKWTLYLRPNQNGAKKVQVNEWSRIVYVRECDENGYLWKNSVTFWLFCILTFEVSAGYVSMLVNLRQHYFLHIIMAWVSTQV